MIRRNISAITAAFAFCCTISGSFDVQAASGSVGVSMTFEVAPADLFRAKSIAPKDVRSCELIAEKINRAWRSKAKRPAIHCSTAKEMPLIATPQSGSDLIVRP